MKPSKLFNRACLGAAVGVLMTAGWGAQAQQSPYGSQIGQQYSQGQQFGQQGQNQFGQGQFSQGQFGQGPQAIRQKLLQALAQGGLLRVQAIDTAYLVQANTPGGAFVTLVVTPPPGEAGWQFQQRIQQLGQFAQGDMGQTREEIQQALQEAGVVNAKVVHDAHLIQARTPGGALATLIVTPSPGQAMAMQSPGSQFGQSGQYQSMSPYGQPG